MKIRILYFASIREIVGIPNETIELDEDPSIDTLKQLLLSQYPALDEHWKTAIISVNKTYSNHNQKLKDGDEVAVFPPISGG